MAQDRLMNSKYMPYVVIFSAALMVYGLIYLFSGDFGITASNVFNSYSIQAASWLGGRLDIGFYIPWLETALFEGRHYISFPPLPSVVMLPFVFFLGTDTPDHAIALAIALLSLAYAYKLGERLLGNKQHAILLALFLVLGTNYLHISLWGAVWYLTQNMAFLFTLMAFYYALTDNKHHTLLSLLALCTAMGCRPFNAIYLPVILYLLYKREDKPFVSSAKRILLFAIPAFILGAFFMWLNYSRFGSIFEFGHTYLPEFMRDYHGQFYAGRMLDNLRSMFFNFNISEFPQFGSFAFWVASPIVISYVIYLLAYSRLTSKSPTDLGSALRISASSSLPGESLPASSSLNCVKQPPKSVDCFKVNRLYMRKGAPRERILILTLPVLVFMHLAAFSFHRTLGGHQFGARYTVDALPAIYLGLLLILQKMPPKDTIYLNLAPMLFGLLLNFYGTIEFLRFYFT